jgi:hypothetical protein
MAEFKAGTREQVSNGQAQYVAGDIVAKDARLNIGGTKGAMGTTTGGEFVRSKTVSIVQERDSNGNITKSKTIMYVEKNEKEMANGILVIQIIQPWQGWQTQIYKKN